MGIVGVNFENVHFSRGGIRLTDIPENGIMNGFWDVLTMPFLLPFLASLLPAAAAGFITNFLWEESLTLKCEADIVDDTLCFKDYGCCEVISSHDISDSYSFWGGLSSNILAVWAGIRIIGYFMARGVPSFGMYATKKK